MHQPINPTFYITMLLSFLFGLQAQGQTNGLPVPSGLRQAYASGTRSPVGIPGPAYWQNSADYALDVSFDPSSRTVSGEGTITYMNNSPDALEELLLLLLPDLYREGNPRDFRVSPEDEHPGIKIRHLMVDGRPMNPSREGSRDITYNATSAWLRLPVPLAAGSSASLEVSWEYPLNKGSHMRTGQVDESSFFIAYWFPRVGVYDDVRGWNDYVYTGVGEFYNDFGDFTIRITAPGNYVVWATGELQNPATTLPEKLHERLLEAKKSPDPMPIIDQGALLEPLTADETRVTWEFAATSVSDFAFALSDHYLWEGFSIPAGPAGKPVFVSVAYPPGSLDFHHVAGMARKAIEYMASEMPGLPFPYPSITVFNGLDEMEYPMMVNNLSYTDLNETFKLTAHEIGHSYFPFLTGCNERQYAWMDEGLTSFFDYHLTKDLNRDAGAYIYFTDYYMNIRGSERDAPLGTASELMRAPDYYAISYAKAAGFYSVLMEQTGKDVFLKGIREFADHWSGKHPTGHDFINTLSEVYGEDLAWLVRPWFQEAGSVDLAISAVRETEGGYVVVVENAGRMPAPVNLLLTFGNGETTVVSHKPEIWKGGTEKAEFPLDGSASLKRIELIQELPIDMDESNNLVDLQDR